MYLHLGAHLSSNGGRPGAVVIGAHVNGLGIVRALAARGVPTAVVRTKAYDFAHRSRFVCAHADALAAVEEPESLVETLEGRSRDWRGWALLPINDEALTALSLYRERLSTTYRVLAPPWETARLVLDKELMLAAAQAVGIDMPRDLSAAGTEAGSGTSLSFPVLVKPFESHRFQARFGRKLFPAGSPEELRACIERARSAGLRCGVYEMIPGGDEQIYSYSLYVSKKGEPGPGITTRKLRQSPPMFGVARVAEITEDQPGLREATVELVRKLGFHGVACAEFKLDPRDSTFRFLEVNGRPVIYNALLRKAGLDFAASAWSEHMEGRVEPVTPTRWPGVWLNLHADLLYSAIHGRREGLGLREFLAPYARPKLEAVWSAGDPGPFLALWGRTAWSGASGIFRPGPQDRLAAGSPPLETYRPPHL